MVAALGLALALVGAGCGSKGGAVSTPTTAAPTSTSTSPPTSTPPTTVAHQLPTVPNCGGGAYEPTALFIVCGGTGATMATDVIWSTWTATGATGTGSVHLTSGTSTSTAPARLTLSQVVSGSVGPQFSLLTVTWTGTSPDGHPIDTFHLAPGG